jgi:hypothetical protein
MDVSTPTSRVADKRRVAGALFASELPEAGGAVVFFG